MKFNFEFLKEKNKKIKFEYVIIFIALIFVFILFLSSNNSSKVVNQKEIEDYVMSLEEKLSTHLSKIEGAGKVSVIISVKEGLTTQIAVEKVVTTDSNGSKTEETPVLVSGKPIILTEIYPEISGVVIIAKGADDLKVKIALLSATQTYLDVTSDKIEILTMG